MKKSLIALILIFIILISYNTIAYSENLTELITEQNELKDKKDETDEYLQNVQEDISENMKQIQDIDFKISEYQVQIDNWNEEIEKIESTIDEIQEDLNIKQEEYDSQYELLKNRLIISYEAGDTSFLDFMLESSNIVDFISNYYLMSELTKYDEELLEEIDNVKQEIETNKSMLESQKSEYNLIKANYQKQKTIMDNARKIRREYVDQLNESEKQLLAQIDEYKRQIDAIEMEIAQITSSSIVLDSKYIGGEMAWPVPGHTKISSNYGMRTHPITGIYKLHSGVDISASTGTDFIAANDGIVTKADYNTAYGNMVIIDHGGGISTLYAHGSEIMVKTGQVVKKGDVVLKVGATGYATGPHAHFEVRIDGKPTNPLPYITNNNTEETNYTED